MAFDTRAIAAIKWGASLALIGGYGATTLHLFPLNIALFLVGNLGWLIVALHWQDRALSLLQATALIAMIGGLAAA